MTPMSHEEASEHLADWVDILASDNYSLLVGFDAVEQGNVLQWLL
jgi:hypothetical protein